jgi:hypothetical protein
MDAIAVSQSILPSDDVQFKMEASVLRCLSDVRLAMCAAEIRRDNGHLSGDVTGALEAMRDIRFLEAVYDKTIEVVRVIYPPREGALQ